MNQNSFNPKARWDRFEPDKTGFDPAMLNERIEVMVLFRNSGIFPRSFNWRGRQYRVETVIYSWQERVGQALISYFSVLSSSQLYQISFNNSTFRWQVDKLIQ
ncbi:MAG: DUF6504 family protein [Candidatus Omnitrophica bacterium]|nr:DUF6504 family protein [Candidatus Omnitrophota bacterium]MDD5506275.1 DUF6504 family protein [Candidatus Omnitrophota bacterium]